MRIHSSFKWRHSSFTNGHNISANKSCCVHSCRKRDIHPDPEIRICDTQILVVPDVRFLGVIFDRRLTFLPHILRLRKKCEKSLNLLKVLSNTSWGADRTSPLRAYQSIVLSRMNYGCAIYGSACNSVLKKLDPVQHTALRICSGALRTSPVQSLYVDCNQLQHRRRKLSLAYYLKILSMPSHPQKSMSLATSMKRLYDARRSNIRPFMDRMKRLITELDLPNVEIQQRNLLLFQPWNTTRFHYINPLANYSKSTVKPVVFQRVFAYHRSQYKANKLVPPHISQTYAQTAKSSPISSATQTDENITKIKCPPLNLLQPLLSPPKPNISQSTPAVTTSLSSTQAQLLPSNSSIAATGSEPQPPTPVSDAMLSAANIITTPLHQSYPHPHPTPMF
ncbi:putative RNA-directed DNA polymerase from transposon X-element [Trichonephila clavipes]|nr:putative RNA-directed DNA polymerase from transposon X-element [Trichonephila clavipes]